jgi:hypothetical protein
MNIVSNADQLNYKKLQIQYRDKTYRLLWVTRPEFVTGFAHLDDICNLCFVLISCFCLIYVLFKNYVIKIMYHCNITLKLHVYLYTFKYDSMFCGLLT